MATVKKTIGRLPVYKGDWVAGTYSMLNQVSYLGSTFQSKIDNNTATPATVVNNALQVNANWSVVSNGTAAYLAGERLTTVEEKNAQLEQNVNLFNRRPQGLRFKAQDNTVFAKTMKALVLGTDDFTVCIVARTEGTQMSGNPLFNFSKSALAASSMKIGGYNPTRGSNGFEWLYFEGSTTGNSIEIGKFDNTTNLHHIVITRSGKLVTCTINGRLVKSVTQDRVLDFSNFIYDIANTSYFWGGAVFNYAMTQAESNKLLWNGGRYNEVIIPETLMRKSEVAKKSDYINVAKDVNIDDIGNGYVHIHNSTTIDGSTLYVNFSKVSMMFIKVSIINNSNTELKLKTYAVSHNELTVPSNSETVFYLNKTNDNYFHFYPTIGDDFNIKITLNCYQCLLEYRPENIRSDRYLNSGTAGSDYDLVYSDVKPEIIYEKPYPDKVMLDENKAPDWHPIAMGQEVITPTNIFKAKLPDIGKEWQVSDWKQINN